MSIQQDILLKTNIKLVGPDKNNKDHHCFEKCVITYEYPAYILATFSKVFYNNLVADMSEKNEKTINIYSVCSPEEFNALEKDFLFLLDFKLFIDPSMYFRYRQRILLAYSDDVVL